jgi:cellulose synthase operon protein C
MSTLVFADREALRAALDSGLVPAEVQAGPVVFDTDEAGQLLLDPEIELERADRKRLREAGVELRRRKLRSGRTLLCFAEALPAQPAPEPAPPLGEVLFVSEGDEGFLQVSGELLRLGCEDQRLGFYTDADGVRRNLCRVADPPYYALLRALDPDDPLRAFTPARPGGRIWIELGAAHPQAGRLEGEPGQLVLIAAPARRAADTPASPSAGAPTPPSHELPSPPAASAQIPEPRPWLRVPDGPWIDLHAVADVVLPKQLDWVATPPSRRLQVQLRLVRAPHKRPPDLWVLRERALEQLEQLVRTVPDEIVARLRVATLERPDPVRGGTQTMVVLRARRSASGPPALDLDAEAYLPAPQIPDLYVPVGMAIDPPLRPSRVRELLAAEPEQVVWLAPSGDEGQRGRDFDRATSSPGFVRERVAESGFAPLSEWVDYLIGAHTEALEPWLRSGVFDLDAYVALDVEWAEGVTPERKPERKPRYEPQPRSTPAREPARSYESTPLDPGPDEDDGTLAALASLAPVELPRNAVELRLAALEREFCQLDRPLDDPERGPRWAELGNLQAALQRSREAGLCWSRALWERAEPSGPTPTALARRWVDSEATMLGYSSGAQLLGIVDVIPSDLDEQMVRALAAAVVLAELEQRHADAIRTIPAITGAQLTGLQRFVSQHAARLDLRTLWLARSALARLAGDDRLALFQTRDLIMASLREGVGLARNVPTFVRTHSADGGKDGDATDLNLLGDELQRIRGEYLATKRSRSTIESTHPEELTHAYVRLVFAWGLARLGRPQEARTELDAATRLLGGRLGERGDPVHKAAFAAYAARVQQALDGLLPGAPLSPDAGGPIALREALSGIDRFKYDRLVQVSRILAPRQDVDAFEKWAHRDDEPFAGLALLTQPERLASLFDQTLADLHKHGPEPRAQALSEIFEYLEALPEPLAVPRLLLAIDSISEVPLAARPRLLRSAMLVAGYYDRADLVDRAVAAIAASDAELLAEQPAAYAELLTRCAPILRRNAHEAELVGLLARIEQRVADDASLHGVTARLHLAAGFAALGQPSRVQPAFAAAHALLPELAGVPTHYQTLLREIAGALGRSSPGQAIAGARALLERLATTTDSMSTNSHFCLAVIQLMEAVVLSLASEDLALSEWARRWVEEDEHLLHRRIHRDLSSARAIR